jgi:hypothetical protein
MKITDLIFKEPITTIQSILYAILGIASYYEKITMDEGGLWIVFILAVFKLFSRDTAFKSPNALMKSSFIGGATGATVKPR